MKKDPDHNSTDSAEIEALITRLERGQLRDEDAQLLARLLRLLLRLIALLQQKNASLSRLKRLLFRPRSDMRMKANPSPVTGAEGESDSASSKSTEQTSSDTPKGAQSRRSVSFRQRCMIVPGNHVLLPKAYNNSGPN
jgi:hypothetical protein